MYELKEKHGLSGNLVYAIAAQMSMFVSSVLMSLVVPKVLGVAEYGYWQLFILYSGYSGMFLLGMNDGLYLRIGGARIAEVDFSDIKAEYIASIALEFILLVIGLSVIVPLTPDSSRVIVIGFSAVYAVVFSASTILSYLFQATNLVHIYSTSVLISRIAYVASLFGLLVIRPGSFTVYIIFYLLSQVIALGYCLFCAQSILACRSSGWRAGLRFAGIDIRSGIKVMISYYAGTLIIGLCRMMIDAKWGIEAFGVYSFSTSLVSFALAFIGQVSLVLFPAIKRMDRAKSRKSFKKIRQGIYYILPLVYVLYFPLCFVLDLWLPQYQTSLHYLALMLPICIFDCKMSMLCDTYFKALRLEGMMLVINVGSMLVSVVLSAVAVFALGSANLAALAMVVAIVVRSVAAELFLQEKMDIHQGYLLVCEVALAACFIVSSFVFQSWIQVLVEVFVFYGASFIIRSWGIRHA